MILLKTIFFLSFILLFTACGTNSSQNTKVTLVDATVVKQAVVNIDNLTVKVHKNTFDVTSKMYSDLNHTLNSYVKMDEAVTNTMDKQMNLLNALAQPFKFADSFKDIFTTNNNYTATTPAFVIKKALTNKYFLVSSDTKFFIKGQTIRTYFTDSTTLANAWKRVINNADKSKDLYLTLVEIDTSNTIHQVATIFVVKKEKLVSF